MTRRLGWKRDPQTPERLATYRNFALLRSTFKADVPSSGSVVDLVVEDIDQGNLGSCVANSGYQAIRMVQNRDKPAGAAPPPLGARLMGYWLARMYDGDQANDDGTQISNFFNAQTEYGFLKESEYTYGYDTTQFATAPLPEDYRKAYDQRQIVLANGQQVVWCHRIFDTGDARIAAVKAAIANRMPVVWGTLFSQDFVNLVISGVLQPPTANQPIAGGHCTVLGAYDANDVFTCINPWQDLPRFQVSPEYVTWAESDDFWVVEKAPVYSEDQPHA